MRTLSAIAIAAAIATVPIGAWVHAAEQYPQTMTSPHFRERCVAWWAGKHPPVGSFTPADAEFDEMCGRLWREEHHCQAHPDRNGCY